MLRLASLQSSHLAGSLTTKRYYVRRWHKLAPYFSKGDVMAKLTMAKLSRMKTYVPAKQRKDKENQNDKLKRLGRVHQLVFSSDSKYVVGFMIARPDIAGMVKQKDVFVALDAISVDEKTVICKDDKDAFDDAACKRLGINFDRCIIWEGCDVITKSGTFLGYVMDACFDAGTGVVDYFSAQEGSAASALVGTFDIPAAWVYGFEKGKMIVRDEAASIELSGGLAAKAGEGYAVAKDKAKEGVAKADEVASKAVDKGSHALGGVIGRAKNSVKEIGDSYQEGLGTKTDSTAGAQKVENQAAKNDNVQRAAQAVGSQLKKSKGMFSDFMREFKDASK